MMKELLLFFLMASRILYIICFFVFHSIVRIGGFKSLSAKRAKMI